MDIHSSLTMIDYAVILVYIILLLSLGFWVSFRKKHTTDLFLAGNTLGWPNVGLSIFGTNVSPTMMIASCGIAYSSGMVAANFVDFSDVTRHGLLSALYEYEDKHNA
ncbi:MAG: hypothetical protein ACYSQZ_09930 [Planctomycetota bacterium]|jgi:SSS family solute:Na+ symporter